MYTSIFLFLFSEELIFAGGAHGTGFTRYKGMAKTGLQRGKHRATTWPNGSTPRYAPKRTECRYLNKSLCVSVHSSGIVMYTMEYKNPGGGSTWMNLKNMLSGKSQTQKVICRMMPFT